MGIITCTDLAQNSHLPRRYQFSHSPLSNTLWTWWGISRDQGVGAIVRFHHVDDGLSMYGRAKASALSPVLPSFVCSLCGGSNRILELIQSSMLVGFAKLSALEPEFEVRLVNRLKLALQQLVELGWLRWAGQLQ